MMSVKSRIERLEHRLSIGMEIQEIFILIDDSVQPPKENLNECALYQNQLQEQKTSPVKIILSDCVSCQFRCVYASDEAKEYWKKA